MNNAHPDNIFSIKNASDGAGDAESSSRDELSAASSAQNFSTVPPSEPTEFSNSAVQPPETTKTSPTDEEFNFSNQNWAFGISDMFRKAAVTGLGAAIMTEEGVRGLLRDLNLPESAKNVIGAAINQAGRQAERRKKEVRRIVGDEVRRLLDSPALKREIAKALGEMAIEMTVRIQLNPETGTPDVTFVSPRICRKGKCKKQSTDEGGFAAVNHSEDAAEIIHATAPEDKKEEMP